MNAQGGRTREGCGPGMVSGVLSEIDWHARDKTTPSAQAFLLLLEQTLIASPSSVMADYNTNPLAPKVSFFPHFLSVDYPLPAPNIGHAIDFCDLTQTEDEHDPHFEPVIKLTEEVVTKTNEEDEAVIFKLYVSFSADPFVESICGGLPPPL